MEVIQIPFPGFVLSVPSELTWTPPFLPFQALQGQLYSLSTVTYTAAQSVAGKW